MQTHFKSSIFSLIRRIAPALVLGTAATGAHAQCDPATLFGPDQQFATGIFPRVVAIGDLDGDGTLDLAVANFASDTVSVLLGNDELLQEVDGHPDRGGIGLHVWGGDGGSYRVLVYRPRG